MARERPWGRVQNDGESAECCQSTRPATLEQQVWWYVFSIGTHGISYIRGCSCARRVFLGVAIVGKRRVRKKTRARADRADASGERAEGREWKDSIEPKEHQIGCRPPVVVCRRWRWRSLPVQ